MIKITHFVCQYISIYTQINKDDNIIFLTFGDFFWDGGDNLPQNSFKPSQDL